MERRVSSVNREWGDQLYCLPEIHVDPCGDRLNLHLVRYNSSNLRECNYKKNTERVSTIDGGVSTCLQNLGQTDEKTWARRDYFYTSNFLHKMPMVWQSIGKGISPVRIHYQCMGNTIFQIDGGFLNVKCLAFIG